MATVTLLDEQDREVNAKFGSWLSTRRVEPPWRINTARESSWTANDLTPPEDGTPKGPQRGHCLAAAPGQSRLQYLRYELAHCILIADNIGPRLWFECDRQPANTLKFASLML